MSTSAIGSTTSTSGSSTLDLLNAKTDAQGKSTLDEKDFFKLLTAQLSAQDPLKPMDDTAFISQMATFSSLQQMQSLNENMTAFTSRQDAANANSYLGKTVTVSDSSGADVTGVVSSIKIDSGTPNLIINGVAYGVDAVTKVSTNQQTTASTSDVSVPADKN